MLTSAFHNRHRESTARPTTTASLGPSDETIIRRLPTTHPDACKETTAYRSGRSDREGSGLERVDAVQSVEVYGRKCESFIRLQAWHMLTFPISVEKQSISTSLCEISESEPMSTHPGNIRRTRTIPLLQQQCRQRCSTSYTCFPSSGSPRSRSSIHKARSSTCTRRSTS